MMTDMNTTVDFSCQRTSLWNDDIFSGSAPRFPDCFQNTVLVWIPCGFLLLCSPFQIASLCHNYVGNSLPLGIRSVIKSLLCIVLATLTCANVVLSSTRGYHCDSHASVPEEYYIGAGALIFVFIYLSVITQALRKNHVISSGILITFWILLLGCSSVPLQSAISYTPSCVTSVIFYIYFTFICIQLVLYSFADKPDHPSDTFLGQKENSPEETASVLNRWFYWWFNGLVMKAYRQTLEVDDLWNQVDYLRSETCVPELEQNWKEEVHKQDTRMQQKRSSHDGSFTYELTSLIFNQKSDIDDDKKSSKNFPKSRPSLLKVVVKTHWKQWLLSSFYKILCDFLALLQPLILKLMIEFIGNKHTNQAWPLWNGWGLAILFFICGAFEALFFSRGAFHMMTLGMKVRVALIGMIYQKSLTMSNAAKSHYTIGDIVNLMSVDCQRIQDAFMFQYQILSFFFMMVLGLYLIWSQMGVATLGSVAVIIIISALNILFGKLQQKYQGIILALKSSRIKLLNEVLSGIKVLKMYTWEPSFTKKLLDIRLREMVFFKKVCVVTAFSTLFSVHSPFMMSYLVLLIFTSMSGNYLDASKVFVTLAIINPMRFIITIVPFVITGVIQMLVSLKRIEEFLCKEDLNPNNVSTSLNTGYAITIEKGYFTWDRRNPRTTLQRINLEVGEGKLVAVVGQVGAGKSSLIAAMLGEMEKVNGHVNVQGSVAYVPQQAWIQNRTVKENILFGSKFSEKKYKRIIQACALLPDLAILNAGDNTEIGERGINVSGGQKQRISLARAVYSNSDVYLLDDPLSAVDSHVGKSLFNEVIGPEGLLRNKTRILVTHGVHWLPKVDLIVVMDEGTISEVGTYEELLQKRGAFSEFLETYLLHGEEDTDSDIAKIKDEMRGQLECVSDFGLSEDDSDRSRRPSTRKASLQRNSRFSIPTEIKRGLSQLNAIVEKSLNLMTSVNNAESQRRFSSWNSKRRFSREDEMNPLEILQRSLSQGRILPYDSGGESEPEDGKLIQDEKSAEGT
ncbi:multidrug resistance-associated protein 1-like, partial [Saccostrea cucullata]|uniref:multidrug resistance-associated protein 1-like n=1 Tax=Saccostrea cuccullata TaxID=36930 RepID=UPI002ED45E05